MPTLRYPIGEYRRWVQIEALPEDRGAETQRNEYREPVKDFHPVAGRWARVEPLDSRSLWRAQQAGALATHKVNFALFPGLTTRHRLRLAGRVLNIEGVTDLEDQHTEHECRCIEQELKPGQQPG